MQLTICSAKITDQLSCLKPPKKICKSVNLLFLTVIIHRLHSHCVDVRFFVFCHLAIIIVTATACQAASSEPRLTSGAAANRKQMSVNLCT